MKQQMQKETEANLQAKVQLARNIEGVVGTSLLLGNGKTGCKTTRHIRENRKKEQQRKHRDFVREYENVGCYAIDRKITGNVIRAGTVTENADTTRV